MKANNILNRILAELSSIREVKFEQMTLENGAVLEAESFEAGNEVFVVSGEDRVAAPIGEHLLADGRILVIEEEGVIAEIKEASEEEAKVEIEVEAEMPTELAEMEVKEEAPAVVAVIERVLEEIAMMREEMKGMREEMGGYAKKEEMAAVKAELSAAPAAKAIKHNPETKQVQKMSSNRPERAIDRVLARINK
jgi:predicted house-cleaning noncanonical NTP pyrophosphatase (MazG superfamily)